MVDASLQVLDRGPTRRLILNRPEKRNALDDALLRCLLVEIQSACADDAVRTIVLSGAGPGFCSGRDRADLTPQVDSTKSTERADVDSRDSLLPRLLTLLIEAPKPTVAAVHGFALAAGQALTLACDFVVAECGSRFGAPEMTYGFPAAMNTALLARHIGRRRALEIAIIGRTYLAEDYLQWGLLNRICEPGKLEGSTEQFVADVNKLVPLSVRRTKQLFRVAEESDFPGLIHAADQLNRLLRADRTP